MKSKRPKKPSEIAATTGGYGELLAGIRQKIATAQVRAHLAVSRELNLLYWQIGQDIVVRQKLEGWGKSVIETLSADLQAAFPGIEGFSANNVWRMRAFYLAYEAEGPILAQPAQEIRAGQPSPILAQLATELPPPEILSIPWFHNVIIIQKLRCFVVIDLKRGAFKPEYASKMNFYLNVVDDQKRHPDDQPSIGLILCQDKKGLVAEYALRGMTKAIGVSEYQLTRKLPKNLKGNLPTIEEIEKELGAP